MGNLLLTFNKMINSNWVQTQVLDCKCTAGIGKVFTTVGSGKSMEKPEGKLLPAHGYFLVVNNLKDVLIWTITLECRAWRIF